MTSCVLLALAGLTSPHVRTMGALVGELSVALRRPVAVERALRNVPVLADEPGRSPAQELNDLADALRASVVRDGKTLRIERSVADRKAVATVHRNVVRRRAEAGLANYDRLLKRSAALGDDEAQMSAAQAAIARVVGEIDQSRAAGRSYVVPGDLVFPGLLKAPGRLALGLMQRLGPEALSDLPPDGVRFFSDRPNAAESPLPKCGDLVAAYERRPSAADAPPLAKLVLRVDEFGATLQAFDAQGHRVARSWLDYANRVVVFGSDVPSPGGADAAWRPLDARSQTMAAFLSPTSDEVVAGRQRSYALTGLPTVPPAPPVPEPYLHSERDDPLDFAVREGVLALPRAPQTAGLVAVLSDGTLHVADDLVRDGRLDVAAFERVLLRGGPWIEPSFERIARGGVTVLRPLDPLASEATLVDRAALGKVVRRVMADGQVGLRDWPAAQLALDSGYGGDVRGLYLGVLVNLGLRYPPSLINPDARVLALVGAALAADRPLVDAGEAPFRAMLRDAVLHDRLTFQPDGSISDLALAPSTLLASGALDRVRIAVASFTTPILDQGGQGQGPFVGSDPGHMVLGPLYGVPAQYVPRTEARTKALFERRYLKRTYRLGERIDLVTEVRLDGALPIRLDLDDSALQRTGVTFEELPPALRDGILASVRKELEQEGAPIPSFLYGNAATGP